MPERGGGTAVAAVKVVVQRVSQASVTIDGRVIASIGRGFVVLVGFARQDGEGQLNWMVEKITGLRLFADSEGRMNLSLAEVDGAVLVVSQFTLYGDARKGRRPSFIDAAPPEQAKPLYRQFLAALEERGLRVASGEFGAMMDVALVNEGPVTLLLER